MAKKLTNTKKPRTKSTSLAKSAAQLRPEQARKIRGGVGYQIISAGADQKVKK